MRNLPDVTVAVLASCRSAGPLDLAFLLVFAGSPWIFFRGQWPESRRLYWANLWSHKQSCGFSSSRSPRPARPWGHFVTNGSWRPCKRRKKTQVGLDLGSNPPKEEGGGDTGRSTGPVMAGGAGSDSGTVTGLSLSHSGALCAPSFDGMDYT